MDEESLEELVQVMNERETKTQDDQSKAIASKLSSKEAVSEPLFQFVDNRGEIVTQRDLQVDGNNCSEALQAAQLQSAADNCLAGNSRVFQRAKDWTALTPANEALGLKSNPEITTLVALNAVLARMNPAVAALNVADFGVAHATAAMVDEVIAEEQYQGVYDGQAQADIIDIFDTALEAKVDAQLTRQLNFLYQTHGNKHFYGGPSGTKFIGDKATINNALELAIQAHARAIRTGATKNFDLYLAKDGTCPEKDDNGRKVYCIKIQLSYDAKADCVEYHGYPFHVDRELGLDPV